MLIAGKENEILKQTQNNKIIITNFTHSSLLPFPYQVPELTKVQL